ncbi:hypothetical protein TNCV_3325421 [Trichonephila clavipes]|nr:hypothetical protein TNCV_3325421 [Trichonephila clavipes]
MEKRLHCLKEVGFCLLVHGGYFISYHPNEKPMEAFPRSAPGDALSGCNSQKKHYCIRRQNAVADFKLLVDLSCWRGGSFECAVRNCWEQEGTYARKPGSGASRKTTRESGSNDRAESTCGPRQPTRSTIRADVGVAIVPQTISGHLQKQI